MSMKTLELFTNRELLNQVAKNILRSRFMWWSKRIVAVSAFLYASYLVMCLLECVTSFINYVVWGIGAPTV